MNYCITGAAGFIGFSLAKTLLEQGHSVLGIDSINDYYSKSLKEMRLSILRRFAQFRFDQLDIKNFEAVDKTFATFKAEKHSVNCIVNLAAQAGVRYSLENPFAYRDSNLDGFLTMLEIARKYKPEHFMFASSSSVYGLNKKTPYAECDAVDHPISLYAATKKANEVMAHSYSHLYKIPTTGLRFFTVYGPYGRPDMAYFKFAKRIEEGLPLDVFNEGNLQRDFTYIDDVVQGIIGLAKLPPKEQPEIDNEAAGPDSSSAPFEIYNIGNAHPESLLTFIELLEKHLGKSAKKNFLPMQPGDVYVTAADTSKLLKAIGWKPSTSLDDGLKKFCTWFKVYCNGDCT